MTILSGRCDKCNEVFPHCTCHKSEVGFEQRVRQGVLSADEICEIRPIRFYCQRCGKELFSGVNLDKQERVTIGAYLNDTYACDDCLLKENNSKFSA